MSSIEFEKSAIRLPGPLPFPMEPKMLSYVKLSPAQYKQIALLNLTYFRRVALLDLDYIKKLTAIIDNISLKG